MKYLILEIQKNGDSVATLINKYNTFEVAQSAYYTILAAAVISAVETHSVVLMTDEGSVVSKETFIHLVQDEQEAEEEGTNE